MSVARFLTTDIKTELEFSTAALGSVVDYLCIFQQVSQNLVFHFCLMQNEDNSPSFSSEKHHEVFHK